MKITVDRPAPVPPPIISVTMVLSVDEADLVATLVEQLSIGQDGFLDLNKKLNGETAILIKSLTDEIYWSLQRELN